MLSVYVRITLIQLATPGEMRGRVSAVNSLFIGASNELGEFESGVTAAWFGTVPSVVIGGVGTVLVVMLWMMFFPELRNLDRLSDLQVEGGAAAGLGRRLEMAREVESARQRGRLAGVVGWRLGQRPLRRVFAHAPFPRSYPAFLATDAV
jgi:hypothetical protein